MTARSRRVVLLHRPAWHLPDAWRDRVAATAVAALLGELETWPKPGLVSHIDSGSHGDMDAATFRASAAALASFFAELAVAGAAGGSMDVLRRIGLRAETAMLKATRGVNTHRGAIFGLGLLCAAAGAVGDLQRDPGQICATVARRWGLAILRGPACRRSSLCWPLWRTPTCFTGAVPQGRTSPAPLRPDFWIAAASGRRIGATGLRPSMAPSWLAVSAPVAVRISWP